MKYTLSLDLARSQPLEFTPQQIDSLMFMGGIRNLSRDQWNTTGSQTDNLAGPTLPPQTSHLGASFTAAGSDYIDTSVALGTPTSYEIFGWLSEDDVTTQQQVIDARDSGTDGISLTVLTGDIVFRHNNTVINIAISVNTWYFYHAYWDGSDITLKVYDANGVIVGTSTSAEATSINVITNTRLGARSFTSTLNFTDGTTKDVYIRKDPTTFIGTDFLDGTITDLVKYAQTDANCLLYYPLAEGYYTEGSVVLDYSINENHGTAHGSSIASEYTRSVGFSVKEDAHNKYDIMDGATTWITMGNIHSFDSDDSFSLSGKFLSYGSTGANQIILEKYASGGSPALTGYSVFIDNTNTALALLLIAGGSGDRLEVRYPIVYGEIYDFQFDYDGTSLASGVSLTVNGVDVSGSLVTTADVLTGSITSTQVLHFGAANGPVFEFDGIISNININNAGEWYGYDWIDQIGANDGTVNGTPSKLNVFETSPSVDFFGNPIPTFVGTTAPDGQLRTGGGIAFLAAAPDYVTFPTITLTGDFTFGHVMDVQSSMSYMFCNSGSTSSRLGISTTTYNGFVGTSIGSTPLDSSISLGEHFVVFKREGTTWTIWVDGILNTTFTHAVSDYVANAINNSNGVYDNIPLLKDWFVIDDAISDARILEYYNNPNRLVELARADNAEMIYTFEAGTYHETNQPIVIDHSGNGNHGTCFGSSIAAVVDSEVGLQLATHGFSEYVYFDGVDDYVTTSAQALQFSQDFVLETDVYLQDTGTSRVLICGSGADDILFINGAGDMFLRGGGSSATFSVSFSTTISNEVYYKLKFVWTASTNTMQLYIDDVLTETDTSMTAALDWGGNLGIGRRASTNTLFTKGLITRLKYNYNGADVWEYFGYDFIDQVGSADGTLNGTPTSMNILSATPKSTTDVFGNTVQRPWKEALLNFPNQVHDGMSIGNTIGVFDTPIVSFFCAFKHGDSGSKVLYATRNSGNGILFYVNADILKLGNEVSSTLTVLDGITSLVEGTWYKAYYVIEASGHSEMYLSEVGSELTFEVDGETGVIDDSQTIPYIGVRNANDLPWENELIYPLLFNNKLTIKELSKLNALADKKINSL